MGLLSCLRIQQYIIGKPINILIIKIILNILRIINGFWKLNESRTVKLVRVDIETDGVNATRFTVV